MRLVLAAAGCLILLGAAAGALWWQDWRYAQPTPRPAGLVQASVGTRLALPELATVAMLRPGHPVLLHFFNPRCPCSRFSLDHVRSLQRQWAGRVDFVAVVQGVERQDVRHALGGVGLDMPAIADPDGRIAATCGVYSTPQAVVLDGAGRLYFRGNYNANRYCTDAASEFARLALDSLMSGGPPPRFRAADIAYGCELPSRRRHG
jgi:hypothetical protein